MVQYVNYGMKSYGTTNLMFKSRYSTATFPTIEFVLSHWMNEILKIILKLIKKLWRNM